MRVRSTLLGPGRLGRWMPGQRAAGAKPMQVGTRPPTTLERWRAARAERKHDRLMFMATQYLARARLKEPQYLSRAFIARLLGSTMLMLDARKRPLPLLERKPSTCVDIHDLRS